jgi:hypothetical protein
MFNMKQTYSYTVCLFYAHFYTISQFRENEQSSILVLHERRAISSVKAQNENFASYMMQPLIKFNRNSCCSLTNETQGKTAKMARSIEFTV